MKGSISLYLVSGFLGSGKTTFLKNMLEQINERKVGVIVNEFGSIGIDGKVLPKGDLELVEINNGSIFCSCLKADFVKALLAFLEQPVDTLFIEASGMADPTSIQTLLEQITMLAAKNMKIERTYDYKGSICITDAVNFLNYNDLFAPVKKQIFKSNFIVINKTDLVSPENLSKVRNQITSLNPSAFIYGTQFASVPLSILNDHLSVGGEIDETVNKPWNRPVTFIVDMKGIYSREQLLSFCLELKEKALRIKGILMTDEGMMHIDAVGDQISFRPMKPTEDILMESRKLVIIGRDSSDFAEMVKNSWSTKFTEAIQFFQGGK